MKWNIVVSGRYGQKLCALDYDDKGNPILGEYPSKVEVTGDIRQARWVAEQLSNYEAGCEHFWIVEGDVEE